MAEPERHLFRTHRKLAHHWQIKVARDDHPHRLAHIAVAAHREHRVVRPRCAATHHHSVMACAQSVHIGACRRARDPLALACGRCDAPIKTAGKFERHKRPPYCLKLHKPSVIAGSLLRTDPKHNLDARRAQHLKSTP